MASLHVHAPIGQKRHALVLEQVTLHFGPAEHKARSEATVFEHHAMAGDDAGFGVGVQRKPYETRRLWVPRQCRDLSVIGNFTFRYGTDYLVKLVKKSIGCHVGLP